MWLESGDEKERGLIGMCLVGGSKEGVVGATTGLGGDGFSGSTTTQNGVGIRRTDLFCSNFKKSMGPNGPKLTSYQKIGPKIYWIPLLTNPKSPSNIDFTSKYSNLDSVKGQNLLFRRH